MILILKKIICINLFILFSAGVLFISSCSVPEKSTEKITEETQPETPKPKYELLAQEKFTGDLVFITNNNNTYMLCISNNKPMNENPFPSLNFFIYDLKAEKIIYEDSLENGNVNWKNNDQLTIHTFPGQIKAETDAPVVYIFDIKKNKKFIDEIIRDK